MNTIITVWVPPMGASPPTILAIAIVVGTARGDM